MTVFMQILYIGITNEYASVEYSEFHSEAGDSRPPPTGTTGPVENLTGNFENLAFFSAPGKGGRENTKSTLFTGAFPPVSLIVFVNIRWMFG